MPKQQICKRKNGASKKSTTLPPEAVRLVLWEQAAVFVERVGERLEPKQFKRFIARLVNYKRKGKHSRFQKEELFQRLNTMLQDHHDLSAELTKFVPKAFRRQAKDCVKAAFERKYQQVVLTQRPKRTPYMPFVWRPLCYAVWTHRISCLFPYHKTSLKPPSTSSRPPSMSQENIL